MSVPVDGERREFFFDFGFDESKEVVVTSLVMFGAPGMIGAVVAEFDENRLRWIDHW